MTSAAVPFWSLVDTSGGILACWPWKANVNRDGYGIWGRKNAHRYAFENAHRQVLTRIAVVRHTCDNPRCCNPLHLITGTQQMNVADRVERGRGAAGRRNGRNVLTEAQVLEIFHSTASHRALGGLFGVDPGTVRDIKKGRIWGWLTAPNSHGNGLVPNVLRVSEVPTNVSR